MTDTNKPLTLKQGDVDPELYVSDLAEMLRDVLRAIAADDSSGPISKASRRIRQLISQVDGLPMALNWYRILEGAINQLKPPQRQSIDYENEYDQVARKATKYLAEITCSDSASTARLGTARRNLVESIKTVETVRELKRQRLI